VKGTGQEQKFCSQKEAAVISTKTRCVENRPSAKMRGTPKSLYSENRTKSQWNPRNSLKVLYIIEKKQI
jgi:hypothetical protein